MPWIVDGSNVLGVRRAPLEADGPKRELVRLLASFARQKRTRVTVVFDGPEPPSFARHLGSVTVAFSGRGSADDLIAQRAANGRGWTVVTADRGLAARVERRDVRVLSPADLLREIEALGAEGEASESDWDEWFSNPENRAKF